MEKKTKKKGFSMVEMLVVIVIIAVLVAVFMPMAVTETVKSHAAANAANLRAIEGKLTTMRLQYPDEFATILSKATGRYEAIKDGYVFIVDILYGQGTGDALLEDRYAKFTAENKVMTLYNPGVVIYDVPQAKAMNLKGSNLSNSVVVSEGTEMTVFITENKVAASYGLYTKDVFADIAEDGKFDGKIQGPQQGGGGITGAWCDLWNKHNWGPDGICKTCGFDKRWHDCVDVKEENMWGQLVAGSDGKCDECGETMPHSCTDGNGDGKCDVCEVTMHICEDTDNNHYCNFRGSWLGQIFSGDTCNKRLSECNEDEIRKTGHHCSICGALVSQHTYAEGVCTLCGRSSHVAPEDCTDNGKDGDHICDTPNCGTQVSTNHPDKDPTDHKCDDCSIELTDKHVDNKGTTYKDGYLTKQCGDHYCDTSACGKKISDCADGNNDGLCDVCRKVVEHEHRDGTDSNHTCDVNGCEVKVSDCVDTKPKDHKCDQCKQAMAGNASCSDTAGDGNHACDYCGQTVGSCSDKSGDGDHLCDECNANVGSCSDSTTDTDHKCDECFRDNVTSCTIKNLNNGTHGCDCGRNVAAHTWRQNNDNNHKCTVSGCGATQDHQFNGDNTCDVTGCGFTKSNNNNDGC